MNLKITSLLHLLFLVFVLPATSAALPVPTNFTVNAATNKRVDLNWTAAPGTSRFVIERRVLGSNDYAVIATVDTAAYADISFDPFTAYQYRARAIDKAGKPDPALQSDAANELTVGPPPAGYQIVAAPTKFLVDNDSVGNFAHRGAMILDSNEDPAFVYDVIDPTLTSSGLAELWFLNWNRGAYRWNPAVRITDSIPVLSLPSVAFAMDGTTGVWGVFVEASAGAIEGSNQLELWISKDKGMSWSKAYKVTQAEESAAGPGLALDKGNVYLSYIKSAAEGINYVTGKMEDDSAKWTQTGIAPQAGDEVMRQPSRNRLMLDSNGIPGLAFFKVNGATGNTTAMFWRPGWTTPVKVTDSLGTYTDFADLSLAFQGTNPRMVVSLPRDLMFSRQQLYSVQSEDGGLTWQAAIHIPGDSGGEDYSMDQPVDLTVHASGKAAVMFSINYGGNICQGPGLSRMDSPLNWVTCGLDLNDPDKTIGFLAYVTHTNLRFASNGKLYAAWTHIGDTKIGQGLVLWREQ